MYDAAREAIKFAEGRKKEDLYSDRMLLLSLVKSIEIIGEGASRISEQGRREVPEIPWKDIITMRNRLIHAYFDIDHNVVWDTIENDIPAIIPILGKILE